MAKKKVQLPPEVLEFFKKEGRKGGKIGSKLSARNLTAKERRERARRAGIESGIRRAQLAKQHKAEEATVAKEKG